MGEFDTMKYGFGGRGSHKVIRYDKPQNLSEKEAAQARCNIQLDKGVEQLMILTGALYDDSFIYQDRAGKIHISDYNLDTNNGNNFPQEFPDAVTIISLGYLSDSEINGNDGLFGTDNTSVENILLYLPNDLTNTTAIFSNILSLKRAILGSRNEINDIPYMFKDCPALTTVDMSMMNVVATDLSGLFLHCENLTKVDMSSFDTRSCFHVSEMFKGCFSLTDFVAPSESTLLPNISFYNSPLLTVTSINSIIAWLFDFEEAIIPQYSNHNTYSSGDLVMYNHEKYVRIFDDSLLQQGDSPQDGIGWKKCGVITFNAVAIENYGRLALEQELNHKGWSLSDSSLVH